MEILIAGSVREQAPDLNVPTMHAPILIHEVGGIRAEGAHPARREFIEDLKFIATDTKRCEVRRIQPDCHVIRVHAGQKAILGEKCPPHTIRAWMVAIKLSQCRL